MGEFIRHADEVTCRSAPCELSTDKHPHGLQTTVDKTEDECKNGDKEAEKEQNRKEKEREKEDADTGETLEPGAEPMVREVDILNPQIKMLQDMGFHVDEEILASLLETCNGDVDSVVEMLM